MKSEELSKEFYTTKELAKYLKIPLSTAYKLTKAKNFPKKLIGKRRFLISVEELKIWLSKNCNGI